MRFLHYATLKSKLLDIICKYSKIGFYLFFCFLKIMFFIVTAFLLRSPRHVVERQALFQALNSYAFSFFFPYAKEQ